MRQRLEVVALTVVATMLTIGCTNGSSPATPSPDNRLNAADAVGRAVAHGAAGQSTSRTSGRPEYGHAYYNGTTVTMNEIEVPQNPHALEHAAADLYAVIYPPNHALWPSPPQCNPCDHNGNGEDLPDFHDHVLDSIPPSPGHGEFNPLWHVLVILPADFSPATQAAYAARLPMTSEAAVDAAVAAGVAREIDTGGYFLCSIVNDHAAN
jgi:hypothetical protein